MIDFEAGIEDENVPEKPGIEFIEIHGKPAQYPEATTLPAVLDPRIAKYQFDEYLEMVNDMTTKAKAHVVTNDESNSHAVAMAGQAKAIVNKIEKLRKSIVDAPNQYVKAVNNFAKQYTGKLGDIECDLKAKINRFQIEQQRKRIEAQKRADEEVQKLQVKINEEAKEANVEPVQVIVPVIPVATVTRTDNGSASLRKVWTWKLVDFSAVPDEYKVINNPVVNQAVKAGVRNIPGIEIYEESQTVIRSASVGNYEKF